MFVHIKQLKEEANAYLFQFWKKLTDEDFCQFELHMHNLSARLKHPKAT